MKLKFLIINIILIGYLNVIANAEEIQKKQTKFEGINFYTGMFDFSDDGKRSNLYGVEHQNENLFKDTIYWQNNPSNRSNDNK